MTALEQAYGVGLVFNRALGPLLSADPTLVDYLAVTPETFWSDARTGEEPSRFSEIARSVRLLDDLATRLPVVAHGISLSIGTAAPLDTAHLRRIAEWHDRYGFRWYSEHLSYTRVVAADGVETHAGVALPVPYDVATLDLMCERVAQVQAAVPVPFALENNVDYAPMPEQELTEPEFFNALAARTGCHVLLDLHNLHVNVTNGFTDADDYLATLDLANVVEIHVAGGREFGGMYTDAHTGPCPPAVWRLLDEVLPRCPNVRGVAFEFIASSFAELGESGVRAELDRARAIWSRHAA